MNQKLKTIRFYAYLISVILAVGMILFHLGTAQASGCEHGCNRTTVIYNNDDDRAKHILQGIAIGAILTCRLQAAWAGFNENRWWTWCGEKEKPEPIPNPGPAPKNDVTPTPTGIRLYQ